jgi:DNA-binding MarR family transcriptional regulator
VVSDATSARDSLGAGQLAAYLALQEVSSVLQHAVEQQLKADGGLTNPQFQILARLRAAPDERARMTDLADGLVYSRSGLTYQAAQLEKAGLVTRAPGEDDERSVTVTLTEAGRARLAQVFPGHIEVVQRLMFDGMSEDDVRALIQIMGRIRRRMRSAPPRSARPRPPRERSPRSTG